MSSSQLGQYKVIGFASDETTYKPVESLSFSGTRSKHPADSDSYHSSRTLRHCSLEPQRDAHQLLMLLMMTAQAEMMAQR